MTGTRVYSRTRRAWTPRLWPVLLLAGAIDVAIALTVNLSWVAAAAIGLGVGFLLGGVRWEVWRYRHPPLTPGQWLDLRRRDAHWN